MNTVAEKPVTALTLPERAAVALGTAQHEIKLRELVQASCRIVAVTNKAGRDECHTAYMVLKNTRCSITNLSDDATEDAKAFTKAVKAEAVRLLKITEAEESRLQALRDEWDAKIEAEKQAKIAAERARYDAIQSDIDGLRAIPQKMIGMDSIAFFDGIKDLQKMEFRVERFAEFADKASEVVADVIRSLQVMMDVAIASEAATLAAEQTRIAEAARIEAERAELAELRAAAAKVAAEQSAEAKRIADLAAAQEAEAKRQRDQAAAEQAERERVAAEAQAKANAELKAAQDKLAADVAAHEAEVKRESDHADALAMNDARDAAILAIDHSEALAMNDQFDYNKFEQAAFDAAGHADDLARCTATVAECLADGRAGIDALTDAADEDMDGRVKSLIIWAEEALDFIVSGIPDRNCSCFISPPCNDCVDHSGVREIAENLREAIDALKGGAA